MQVLNTKFARYHGSSPFANLLAQVFHGLWIGNCLTLTKYNFTAQGITGQRVHTRPISAHVVFWCVKCTKW